MNSETHNWEALLLALDHGLGKFTPHIRLLCKEIAYTKINYLRLLQFRPPVLKYFWEDMETFIGEQCRIFPKCIKLSCGSIDDLQKYPILADNLEECRFSPIVFWNSPSVGISRLALNINLINVNNNYDLSEHIDFIGNKLGHLEALSFCTNLSDVSMLANVKRLAITNSKIIDVTSLNQLRELRIALTSVDGIASLISPESKIKILSLRMVRTFCRETHVYLPIATIPKFDCQIQKLYLSGSNIRDIAPLFASSNQLDTLDLSYNYNIKDITSMKNSKLRILNLFGTEIEDVSVLSTLSKLEELNLGRTNVIDVSMFNKIAKVNLRQTMVCDVRAFGAPDSLTQELVLADTEVVDVSMLGKLRTLSLHNTKIGDVSALGQIYDLNLGACKIKRGCSLLTNVQKLYLHGARFNEKLSLHHKKELNLAGTINPDIQNISHVRKVNLSRTIVRDVTSLVDVQELDISQTNVRKIPYFPNLTSLSVSGCNIDDHGELTRLTNLEKLDISCTPINDISTLTKLQILVLSRNNMNIGHLKNLRAIALGKAQAVGIDRLRRLEIISSGSSEEINNIKNLLSQVSKLPSIVKQEAS
jgi:hypothetical protein